MKTSIQQMWFIVIIATVFSPLRLLWSVDKEIIFGTVSGTLALAIVLTMFEKIKG